MEIERWNPLRGGISGWDPFRELEMMSDRLNRVIGPPSARREGGKEAMTVAQWAPVVDVIENEKEYLIKAELPEVKKEDVKVTAEEGVLLIQGERKAEKEEKGKRYHRIERLYGSFLRSFTIPDDVDEDRVTADFKEGMLNIHLPKSEKAKPKKTEVRIT
jgi:HSP20 family protein